MKYLDFSGLSRFWNKIKSYFSELDQYLTGTRGANTGVVNYCQLYVSLNRTLVSGLKVHVYCPPANFVSTKGEWLLPLSFSIDDGTTYIDVLGANGETITGQDAVGRYLELYYNGTNWIAISYGNPGNYSIGGNLAVTGTVTSTGGFTGNLSGNATTATNATHATSADSATTATTADNATKWNNITYDMSTNNTTSTWVPVLTDGKFQHRVISADLNNRGVYNLTSKGHTNFNTNQNYLPTVNTLSFWNGAYNGNNSSNLTYAHQGTIQCKPTSLYDNTNGATGTVTLSQTSANFTYLQIFYKHSSNSTFDSTMVYSPNGKIVSLPVLFGGTTGQYLGFAVDVVTISGTSITRATSSRRVNGVFALPTNGLNVTTSGNPTNNANTTIVKVIGIK